MKKIALIKNSVVVNVAVWDGASSWNPGDQYVKVDVTNISVSPGDLYDPKTGSFSKAPRDGD